MSELICPLCRSTVTRSYHRDGKRAYLQCEVCQLVFVPAQYHLNEEQEKAEYDLHQNDPSDEGYRNFLRRLAQPLLERIPDASRGLDFGSGPGPTLHLLLEEAGHSVALYDKFYAPNDAVFSDRFDFITATEVVEHLRAPGEVLAELWSLLRPGGVLALMTKRVTTLEAFSRWHYKNDPTHIAFFSEQTFLWLAGQWQAQCGFPDKDVVLLQKIS